MNDEKFLKNLLENIKIKKADILEKFEENKKETKSLYITLEKPLKFSITRKNGFCSIIADAIDLSKQEISFIVNNYDVLSTDWDSIEFIKWTSCSEKDYEDRINELKEYE